MSLENESSLSLYLAKLVDQIRSVRLSLEDRLILRQHLLDVADLDESAKNLFDTLGKTARH